MLGFQQFLAQDGDVTLELVEEGKEHIKREKRRRQRLAESATRRRDFANRFGDIEANSRGKIKSTFLKFGSAKTLILAKTNSKYSAISI